MDTLLDKPTETLAANIQKEQLQELFNQMFAPHSVQGFFENYYEKNCFHGKQSAVGIANYLPGVDYYKQLIELGDLRFPTVMVLKDGKNLNYRQYSDVVNIGGVNVSYANKSKVLNHLADGGSLVFNNMHLYHNAVANVNELYKKTLNCSLASSTVFLTPSNSQGFGLHYDPHDVILFQIDGAKHWKVYAPVETLPIEGSLPMKEFPPTECLFDGLVEAGDILYIPRGFPHEAITTEARSLHLSTGLRPIKWLHLIDKLFIELSAKKAVRQTMPANVLNNPTLVREYLLEVLANTDDDTLSKAATNAFGELNDENLTSQNQPFIFK